MLTRIYIEKTLLDLAGLELAPGFNDKEWKFFSGYRNMIGGCIRRVPERDGIGWGVCFQFESEKFVQMVLAASETKVFSEGLNVYVYGEEALESFCRSLALVIEALPEDFQIQDIEKQFDPSEDEKITEKEAMVRQRRGQDLYRKRLEELWGGCCAVTGVEIPELLRASHAKPWKECQTGKERLDPYNGFLLAAHLDALFDKFLISFDDDGGILISSALDLESLSSVGIASNMKLKNISPKHLPYLRYHRRYFKN